MADCSAARECVGCRYTGQEKRQGLVNISKNPRESGASEVVGEMLMIGLAIILISVFASVMGNFLPGAHDPSITIIVTNDSPHQITLWHKGGDWVRAEDLKIIFGDDDNRENFIYNRTYTNPKRHFQIAPKKETFDLGSNITITTKREITRNDTVSMVTSHASIFSGKVLP